jgi:hypothetical protein
MPRSPPKKSSPARWTGLTELTGRRCGQAGCEQWRRCVGPSTSRSASAVCALPTCQDWALGDEPRLATVAANMHETNSTRRLSRRHFRPWVLSRTLPPAAVGGWSRPGSSPDQPPPGNRRSSRRCADHGSNVRGVGHTCHREEATELAHKTNGPAIGPDSALSCGTGHRQLEIYREHPKRRPR